MNQICVKLVCSNGWVSSGCMVFERGVGSPSSVLENTHKTSGSLLDRELSLYHT